MIILLGPPNIICLVAPTIVNPLLCDWNSGHYAVNIFSFILTTGLKKGFPFRVTLLSFNPN